MSTATGPVSAAEWEALRSGAAVATQSGAGVLWLTGTDVLDLLNRISTNKLEALPAGNVERTVLTNGDGRVVDLLSIVSVESGFWCLTSAGRAEPVAEWIDLYTFSEDISVEDRTAAATLLSLVGPHAVATAAAVGIPELLPGQAVTHRIAGVETVATRVMTGGAEGFDLIVPGTGVDAVRSAIEEAGAQPVGAAAWEAYRIANGMPAYGTEFGEFNNPLEARLMGIISEDKGCYTGQEVIARLVTYRKVQHRLMAVEVAGTAQPGGELAAGDEPAGRLTSVADLPGGETIGLALVRAAHASPGETLTVAGGSATVEMREPAYAVATEPVED